MGVDLRQWDTVRERFLRRFCRATRETVLAQLYRNTWRGDHGLYIARFSQAVTHAVTFTSEELVELFLSKLPPDIKRQLTHNGTICYHDWEEAAVALSRLEEPMCVVEAAHRRCLQSMEEAFNKVQARKSQFRTAGGQQNPAVFRCRECQGVGHKDLNCPFCQAGHTPKPGTTCKRCGGKEPFSKDCAVRALQQLLMKPPQRRLQTPVANYLCCQTRKPSCGGRPRARLESTTGVLASTVATGPNAIIVSPEWRRQLIERNASAEGAVIECATARTFPLESEEQGDTSLDSTDKQHRTSECSDHRANGALGSVSAEERDTVSGARPVSQIDDVLGGGTICQVTS